jgi:hypothetical protein
VCNLYFLIKGRQAIRDFTRAMRSEVGNMPLMPNGYLHLLFRRSTR